MTRSHQRDLGISSVPQPAHDTIKRQPGVHPRVHAPFRGDQSRSFCPRGISTSGFRGHRHLSGALYPSVHGRIFVGNSYGSRLKSVRHQAHRREGQEAGLSLSVPEPPELPGNPGSESPASMLTPRCDRATPGTGWWACVHPSLRIIM